MEQSRKKHFTFRMTNDDQPIMISNNNPQKKGKRTQSRKISMRHGNAPRRKGVHGEGPLIPQ